MSDRSRREVTTKLREARGRTKLSAEPQADTWDLPLTERPTPAAQLPYDRPPPRRSVNSAALPSPAPAPTRQPGALNQPAATPRATGQLRVPPRLPEPEPPAVEPARRAAGSSREAPPPARSAADLALQRLLAQPAASAWSGELRYSLSGPNRWRGLVVIVVLLAGLWALWDTFNQPMRIYMGNMGGSPVISGSGKALPPVIPGQHSIVGSPTISAGQIEQVLEHYGSPAAGTGQAWVSLGQRYNIDPAYALAFFIQESSAGTAPGWAGIRHGDPGKPYTYNIGNIICANYATCYGRFRDYPSWEAGIDDWYRLLSVEYISGRGITTLEDIIPVYAPAFENDVTGYIQVVESLVNDWRRGVIR